MRYAILLAVLAVLVLSGCNVGSVCVEDDVCTDVEAAMGASCTDCRTDFSVQQVSLHLSDQSVSSTHREGETWKYYVGGVEHELSTMALGYLDNKRSEAAVFVLDGEVSAPLAAGETHQMSGGRVVKVNSIEITQNAMPEAYVSFTLRGADGAMLPDTFRLEEMKTLEIDGVSYEVQLVEVSPLSTDGRATAKFRVNNEYTHNLTQGQSDTLVGGHNVQVNYILYSVPRSQVWFTLSAEDGIRTLYYEYCIANRGIYQGEFDVDLTLSSDTGKNTERVSHTFHGAEPLVVGDFEVVRNEELIMTRLRAALPANNKIECYSGSRSVGGSRFYDLKVKANPELRVRESNTNNNERTASIDGFTPSFPAKLIEQDVGRFDYLHSYEEDAGDELRRYVATYNLPVSAGGVLQFDVYVMESADPQWAQGVVGRESLERYTTPHGDVLVDLDTRDLDVFNGQPFALLRWYIVGKQGELVHSYHYWPMTERFDPMQHELLVEYLKRYGQAAGTASGLIEQDVGTYDYLSSETCSTCLSGAGTYTIYRDDGYRANYTRGGSPAQAHVLAVWGGYSKAFSQLQIFNTKETRSYGTVLTHVEPANGFWPESRYVIYPSGADKVIMLRLPPDASLDNDPLILAYTKRYPVSAIPPRESYPAYLLEQDLGEFRHVYSELSEKMTEDGIRGLFDTYRAYYARASPTEGATVNVGKLYETGAATEAMRTLSGREPTHILTTSTATFLTDGDELLYATGDNRLIEFRVAQGKASLEHPVIKAYLAKYPAVKVERETGVVTPDACAVSPPFSCVEYSAGDGLVMIRLKNDGGIDMPIAVVQIAGCGASAAQPLANGASMDVSIQCSLPAAGEVFSAAFNVTYRKTGDTYSKVSTGSIRTRVQGAMGPVDPLPPQELAGATGVNIFLQNGAPPAQVYDAGRTRFAANLVLENVGEEDIGTRTESPYVIARLEGASAGDLGTTEARMKLPLRGMLVGAQRLEDGTILGGQVTQIAFSDLSYKPDVQQDAIVTLRATLCYDYANTAVLPACKGCTEQPVQNSAGPLRITQATRRVLSDTVTQFDFTVEHVGPGMLYGRSTTEICDPSVNTNKHVVDLSLEPAVPTSGISCRTLGNKNAGRLTLPNGGPAAVSCRVTHDKRTGAPDVTVRAEYRYGQSIEQPIAVKP